MFVPAVLLAAALPLAAPQAAAAPIAVTDAAGRTVTLKALPRRIVVVGNGPYIIAHLLQMFPEGRERTVALEKRHGAASDFLPLIDPGFSKKILFEANAGPEEIAAIKPDLVLVRGTATDDTVKVMEPLNVPVIYLGLESPSDYRRDIRNLGLVLGNPARAAAITGFFQGRVDRVAKSLAGLPEKDKPRVLLAMAIARGGQVAIQVPALPWIQTVMVQTAGGSVVWADAAKTSSGWTIVNIEQIAAWNPDVIILIPWYKLDAAKTLGDFRADPRWKALKALRSGAFHAFPADVYGWDTPDPRWILGLEWLVKILHPRRSAGFSMNDEIDRFFGELFGLDAATIASVVRPRLRMEIR